jgi:hypothetical protein
VIFTWGYKKNIISLKHRSTNFKYDYTWEHDSLAKLGFIKVASPKHVIFERPCKLQQIKCKLVI